MAQREPESSGLTTIQVLTPFLILGAAILVAVILTVRF